MLLLLLLLLLVVVVVVISCHFCYNLYKVNCICITNSVEQSPSWEANRCSASQEGPSILWTMSITVFTNTCHLFMFWARSIQSMPSHPTSWRSIFLLSSHLHQGLPSGLKYVEQTMSLGYVVLQLFCGCNVWYAHCYFLW